MTSSPEAPADPSSLPVLKLRHGEDRRLNAGHLWVFSNEVDTARTPLTALSAGDLVRLHNDRDRFLGYAYVNPHSLIAARIVGRDPEFPVDKSLIVHRLKVALSLRQRLFDLPYYRLVYGESDGLPGLVVDRFGDVLSVQIGTAGMERLKPEILAALDKVIQPAGVLWKNDSSAREMEGLPSYVETASGYVPETVEIVENGARYAVPLATGQKTGWFYDQAFNRRTLLRYTAGARVLDVFSYLGAWGIGAASHGATEVVCVDSSSQATDLIEQNAAANNTRVKTVTGDAFDVLENMIAAKEKFDVVILDPPAFIRRRKDIPKGQAAYKRLNQLGMQVLGRDGLLVSCSCSYHLEEQELLNAIQKAARHVGRFAQVLEFGGQAPDHPVHPAIAETRYLKSLFCRVVQE